MCFEEQGEAPMPRSTVGGSPLAPSPPMRDPRYRFSDDVRATTRAIALRMVHARDVASSPEALGAWIARTDDVRERLTAGGYGSEFGAGDLFPLFHGFVVKATTPAPSEGVRTPTNPWVWIALTLLGIAVVVALALSARGAF